MSKLVRDRIPIITRNKGLKFKTIPKSKFKRALAAKLVEEAREYNGSLDFEELADVLEVLLALLKENKKSWRNLQSMRRRKRKLRGAFKQRLALV